MSTPAVTLRPATLADLEALTRLAHAAKGHWGYPAAWLDLWRDDLTFTPATLAEQHVVCAEQDGAVVGAYALSETEGRWEIEHFWVDPAAMGQGLGRRLFDHAVAFLRSQGAEAVYILSDPYAEGFYERMGARRVDVVPSVPEGRTLPLLVLDL